jgi:gamma-glutamyltranspeptidase / glutathione hydrolase
MRSNFTLYLITLLVLFGISSLALKHNKAQANPLPLLEYDSLSFPEVASKGMVSTQEAKATQVGVDILNVGGNAVDAAVAVGFTLAVTLPRAGNIGGGGFMMIYDAKTEQVKALDYREFASMNASRDMFLKTDKTVDEHKSRFSNLSAAIPGTVAGLIKAHKTFGRLPLTTVMQPAIELAKSMTLSQSMAQALNLYQGRLSAMSETRKIYTKADRSMWQKGDRFVQIDLARTLTAIAKTQGDDFYRGAVALKIADYFSENGGIITLEDLAEYKAIWRNPIAAGYKDIKLFSMPPPSSGGVHLIQLLNLINQFPIDRGGANSAYNSHIKVEAMKFAYADRSKYLGDPDFNDVPVQSLINHDYAKKIAQQINLDKALKSSQVHPGQYIDQESPQTTHFSIIDHQGNMVSNTYTLNYSFGSGITVPGTGMLLNNQMDDFSIKPGVANSYGLVGGEANAIQAMKRPLSSMTPVIVLKNNKPWIATGSPGGSKIISIVANFLVNRFYHSMNIAEATLLPRVHHQWYPDILKVEKGFPIDTAKLLKAKGHKVLYTKPWGSLQSVELSDGVFYGYSDTRRPGALSKGVD